MIPVVGNLSGGRWRSREKAKGAQQTRIPQEIDNVTDAKLRLSGVSRQSLSLADLNCHYKSMLSQAHVVSVAE